MQVAELIALFRRMLAEKWHYTWGAAEEGNVDCSGALVWAYRQAGLRAHHGSNRLARDEAMEMLPLSSARPGMLAFKARPPDADGYALPDAYKKGGSRYNGDISDYYHIGVIDTDTRYVLNAQSPRTGFVRSPIKSGWTSVAYARQIDYGDQEDTIVSDIRTATVRASNGSTVNMRKTPGGDLLDRVPVGAVVQVIGESGEWRRIAFAGREGWMMSRFLDVGEASTEAADDISERVQELEERIRLLSERVQALEGGVG